MTKQGPGEGGGVEARLPRFFVVESVLASRLFLLPRPPLAPPPSSVLSPLFPPPCSLHSPPSPPGSPLPSPCSTVSPSLSPSTISPPLPHPPPRFEILLAFVCFLVFTFTASPHLPPLNPPPPDLRHFCTLLDPFLFLLSLSLPFLFLLSLSLPFLLLPSLIPLFPFFSSYPTLFSLFSLYPSLFSLFSPYPPIYLLFPHIVSTFQGPSSCRVHAGSLRSLVAEVRSIPGLESWADHRAEHLQGIVITVRAWSSACLHQLGNIQGLYRHFLCLSRSQIWVRRDQHFLQGSLDKDPRRKPPSLPSPPSSQRQSRGTPPLAPASPPPCAPASPQHLSSSLPAFLPPSKDPLLLPPESTPPREALQCPQEVAISTALTLQAPPSSLFPFLLPLPFAPPLPLLLLLFLCPSPPPPTPPLLPLTPLLLLPQPLLLSFSSTLLPSTHGTPPLHSAPPLLPHHLTPFYSFILPPPILMSPPSPPHPRISSSPTSLSCLTPYPIPQPLPFPSSPPIKAPVLPHPLSSHPSLPSLTPFPHPSPCLPHPLPPSPSPHPSHQDACPPSPFPPILHPSPSLIPLPSKAPDSHLRNRWQPRQPGYTRLPALRRCSRLTAAGDSGGAARRLRWLVVPPRC
ncbi:hypothetical protein C7M84_009714 [Penaeus vannamei]|uniref:Uncharacterized protein n=1 Tax=Penaeus vannamei TaxID=6689 RepID=A0A423T6A5_PENVA|nr:hypothetical protein C7M84_009714 [Penaeus vannamei]